MTKIPGKDNPAADNDEIGGAVPLTGSPEQDHSASDAAFHALQSQVSSDVDDVTTGNDLAIDKTYRAQETVNGHEISVAYDERNNGYTIYFPGLQLGNDEADRHDITDSIIVLGKDRSEAMEVFVYAKSQAKITRNPYTLYRIVKSFAHPDSY